MQVLLLFQFYIATQALEQDTGKTREKTNEIYLKLSYELYLFYDFIHWMNFKNFQKKINVHCFFFCFVIYKYKNKKIKFFLINK